MRDYRSPEATAYRRLYNTPRWRARSKAFLREHPLCQRCDDAGFLTSATTVNHRTPHKGDDHLFWSEANWQALCKPCHDGPVQAQERTGKANSRVGYDQTLGRDGLPTDPRHPFNRG